jgi:hypothetical protein
MKKGTQYIQNKMFKEDTKNLQKLGHKKYRGQTTPSVAEVEPYWKSLWAEKPRYN